MLIAETSASEVVAWAIAATGGAVTAYAVAVRKIRELREEKLKQKRDDATADVDAELARRHKKLELKKAELEQEKAERDDIIAQYKSHAADAQASIGNINSRVDALQAALMECREKCAAKAERIKSLEDQIAYLKLQIGNSLGSGESKVNP